MIFFFGHLLMLIWPLLKQQHLNRDVCYVHGMNFAHLIDPDLFKKKKKKRKTLDTDKVAYIGRCL